MAEGGGGLGAVTVIWLTRGGCVRAAGGAWVTAAGGSAAGVGLAGFDGETVGGEAGEGEAVGGASGVGTS